MRRKLDKICNNSGISHYLIIFSSNSSSSWGVSPWPREPTSCCSAARQHTARTTDCAALDLHLMLCVAVVVSYATKGSGTLIHGATRKRASVLICCKAHQRTLG